MNTKILLGVLFCLVAVNATKQFGETPEPSKDADVKRANNNGEHHRRKRYHMNYGYNYQPPMNPFYDYNRRDYDRNQQDLLPEILRLLDEISAYVRRPPPPPPQPIYIPYAVPYPTCNCPTTTPPKATAPPPTINSRFPTMDDSNQNWGLVDEGAAEEEGDGTRPLSFTPIKPKRPLSRAPIPLEHGSQFASSSSQQESRVTNQNKVPDMCDIFSLSCCTGTPVQQKQCLIKAGCPNTYDNGRGCDQERLLNIIDTYSKAYAPVQ